MPAADLLGHGCRRSMLQTSGELMDVLAPTPPHLICCSLSLAYVSAHVIRVGVGTTAQLLQGQPLPVELMRKCESFQCLSSHTCYYYLPCHLLSVMFACGLAGLCVCVWEPEVCRAGGWGKVRQV